MQTFYEVDVHLLKCGGCGKVWYESLPFLPHPMARITKSFARLMIRRVYSFCETRYEEKTAIEGRCLAARESNIPEMIQMANTIENRTI